MTERNNILIATHQNAIRCLLGKLNLYNNAFFGVDEGVKIKVANGSIVKLSFERQGYGWSGYGQFVFAGLMPEAKHIKLPATRSMAVEVENDDSLQSLFATPGVGNGDAIDTTWETMTVWLIRHGRGYHNATGASRVARGIASLVSDVITDAQLDSTGRLQAQAAGVWLNFCSDIASGTIKYMGASDMLRAQQTMNLARLRIHPRKFDITAHPDVYRRIKVVPCNYEIAGDQECGSTGYESIFTPNQPRAFVTYAASLADVSAESGGGPRNIGSACANRSQMPGPNSRDTPWSGVGVSEAISGNSHTNPLKYMAPVLVSMYNIMLNPYFVSAYKFFKTTIQTYLYVAGSFRCGGPPSLQFTCPAYRSLKIQSGSVAMLEGRLYMRPGGGSQLGVPVVVMSPADPPADIADLDFGNYLRGNESSDGISSGMLSDLDDFYGGHRGGAGERWTVMFPDGSSEVVSDNLLKIAPPFWTNTADFMPLFDQMNIHVMPTIMNFVAGTFLTLNTKRLPNVAYAIEFSSNAQASPLIDWREYIAFYKNYTDNVPCKGNRLAGPMLQQSCNLTRGGLVKAGCDNPCNGITMLTFISDLLQRTLVPGTRRIRLYGQNPITRRAEEPVEERVEEPVVEPVEEPVEEPTEEPVGDQENFPPGAETGAESGIGSEQPPVVNQDLWSRLAENRKQHIETIRNQRRNFTVHDGDRFTRIPGLVAGQLTPRESIDSFSDNLDTAQQSESDIQEEPITPPPEPEPEPDLVPPRQSNSLRARAGRFMGNVGRSIGSAFRRVTRRRGGRGRGTRRALERKKPRRVARGNRKTRKGKAKNTRTTKRRPPRKTKRK